MTELYLANENFPAVIVRTLRSAGDDVLYAAETLIAAPDEQVLKVALEQNRVVLTFDQDFGELVFHHREPPPQGVVLFRLGGLSPDGLLAFLRSFFDSQPSCGASSPWRAPGTSGRFRYHD